MAECLDLFSESTTPPRGLRPIKLQRPTTARYVSRVCGAATFWRLCSSSSCKAAARSTPVRPTSVVILASSAAITSSLSPALRTDPGLRPLVPENSDSIRASSGSYFSMSFSASSRLRSSSFSHRRTSAILFSNSRHLCREAAAPPSPEDSGAPDKYSRVRPSSLSVKRVL